MQAKSDDFSGSELFDQCTSKTPELVRFDCLILDQGICGWA